MTEATRHLKLVQTDAHIIVSAIPTNQPVAAPEALEKIKLSFSIKELANKILERKGGGRLITSFDSCFIDDYHNSVRSSTSTPVTLKEDFIRFVSNGDLRYITASDAVRILFEAENIDPQYMSLNADYLLGWGESEDKSKPRNAISFSVNPDPNNTEEELACVTDITWKDYVRGGRDRDPALSDIYATWIISKINNCSLDLLGTGRDELFYFSNQLSYIRAILRTFDNLKYGTGLLIRGTGAFCDDVVSEEMLKNLE